MRMCRKLSSSISARLRFMRIMRLYNGIRGIWKESLISDSGLGVC